MLLRLANSLRSHTLRAMGNSASAPGAPSAAAQRVDEMIAAHPLLMFSKTTCGYCAKAKQVISAAGGADLQVVELNEDPQGAELQAALAEKTGQRTVPNTFLGGAHVGGCDDVLALERGGSLAARIAAAPAQLAAALGEAAKVAAARATFSEGCAAVAGPRAPGEKLPLMGDESMMAPKAHGSSAAEVQDPLRYGADRKVADQICSFNRHYAEHGGYFEGTAWLRAVKDAGEVIYYDSVTGKPLFIAPRGRSFAEFAQESAAHGWPSFRDEEVVWENVRCLPDGECISVDGTHLGHNLPSGMLGRKRNRYCINLVSVAGSPAADPPAASQL